MSCNIGLYNDEGNLVKVDHFIDGGTYPVDGCSVAELNITYNYSWFFHKCLDKEEGLKWLCNKKAKDTIKRLQKAVEELGVDQFDNYWAPTPGNAGYALEILLKWAIEYPNAIWQGG